MASLSFWRSCLLCYTHLCLLHCFCYINIFPLSECIILVVVSWTIKYLSYFDIIHPYTPFLLASFFSIFVLGPQVVVSCLLLLFLYSRITPGGAQGIIWDAKNWTTVSCPLCFCSQPVFIFLFCQWKEIIINSKTMKAIFKWRVRFFSLSFNKRPMNEFQKWG